MRLPIALFVLALLAPATAHAGTVGLEGTQLVFRADAGERVSLISGNEFHGQSAAVTIDAGPGDDRGVAEGRQLSVLGGEGDDELTFQLADHGSGPLLLDGGAGDDTRTVQHVGPVTTRPGGERQSTLAPVAITCGPGADRWSAGPFDVPDDGCAGSLAGITTKTVSRAFREGALTARATGSVTLTRRAGVSDKPRERIARGVFAAEAGPLRVSLKRTAAGTRWLRRTPRLPVFVTIRTRTGSDRGEVTFQSKVG